MSETRTPHPGSPLHLSTQVIHAGQRPDAATGAVVPPISTSVTYAQLSPGEHKGFEYSRSHNPTRYALERMMAALEGSSIPEEIDPSCGAFAFASGMAATATVLELLDQGDRLVAMDDLYGGTRRFFTRVRARSQGLDVVYADLSDLAAFEAVMTPETRMVWVETPTNPTMKIVDLEQVAARARSVRPDVILVCDNTFASPLAQRPLELGFDLVLHSTTKYINGHSDVIGGVVVARDLDFVKGPEGREAKGLRFLQNAAGTMMSPFDAYQTLRGVKTLALRMERHNHNAQRLAEHLVGHPRVEKVIYPGLPSHPQYELAKRQMRLAGGMLSLCLRGGLGAARSFCESVRIFQLAESLGAVESLVNHPALMTHLSVPPEVRSELGITDSLLRLSVGIENVDDLIADVEQALEASTAPRR